MEKLEKVNIEDFKLENILSPDRVITPTADPIPDPEPVIKDQKPTPAPKAPVEVPKPDDSEPEEDEDDGEEIPQEMPLKDGELDLKPFYQAFHEKLGWEVPDEDLPENSIEGLIGYMDNLVTQASKPQYSNPVVEQFDRFVASGGDPKRFVDTMFNQKDYTAISAEDVSDLDKKQIIRDYLSKSNPEKDKSWVDKKLTRYEDAGTLDDEFSDALSELKYTQDKEKKELVGRQEAAQQAELQKRQEQLELLQDTLVSKKDIAGIPVNKKEMGEFYNFMTHKQDDGYTKYEKALMSDSEAVIKMAYLAFKGFDVNNLKTAVRTDVTKDIKKALSRYTSTTSGIQSRTAIPAKAGRSNFKDFETGL